MLECVFSSEGGSGNDGVSGAGSEDAVVDVLRALGISLGSFACDDRGRGTAEVAMISVQVSSESVEESLAKAVVWCWEDGTMSCKVRNGPHLCAGWAICHRAFLDD